MSFERVPDVSRSALQSSSGNFLYNKWAVLQACDIPVFLVKNEIGLF